MSTNMRRNIVWKTPDISANGLKIFAGIMMLLYSIGIAIVENGMIQLNQYTQESLSAAMAEDSQLMWLAGTGSLLQLMGGLAVPVFAFLLVEGFRNTSDYKKYLLSMIVFSVISEIPYDLAMKQKIFDWSSQNGMIAMTICLLMLYLIRMAEKKEGFLRIFYQILIVMAAIVWVSLFRAAFGLCLVLLSAIFYLFYEKNVLKMVLGAIVSLLYVTGPISFYIIWCYNGVRREKYSKYLFYAFYPLHLLVLGGIAMFMTRV